MTKKELQEAYQITLGIIEELNRQNKILQIEIKNLTAESDAWFAEYLQSKRMDNR
jgi:hypothetical protein